MQHVRQNYVLYEAAEHEHHERFSNKCTMSINLANLYLKKHGFLFQS